MNRKKYIVYKLLRSVFKPVFNVLFRPRIIGNNNIPKNGKAVLAGNHNHALDPILVDICTSRIVRTLAKKELHDGRFGFLFREVGTIPVDLHSKRNHNALEAAVKALNNDELVNVSPEAKRNYTNQLLLPFKFGAAVMSARTQAPIIPYAISGDYKLFSHNLTIIFGKPFYVSDDIDSGNKRLYDSVADLLKRINTEELIKKNFTPYDEWSEKSEKTS